MQILCSDAYIRSRPRRLQWSRELKSNMFPISFFIYVCECYLGLSPSSGCGRVYSSFRCIQTNSSFQSTTVLCSNSKSRLRIISFDSLHQLLQRLNSDWFCFFQSLSFLGRVPRWPAVFSTNGFVRVHSIWLRLTTDMEDSWLACSNRPWRCLHDRRLRSGYFCFFDVVKGV